MSGTKWHQGSNADATLKNLFKKSVNTLYEELLSIIEKHSGQATRITEKYPWIHVHQAARYIELLSERDFELIMSTRITYKSIRINTLITTREDLTTRLIRKGVQLRSHPFINYGLLIDYSPYPVGALHEYILGLYTLQGPASMMAVPALSPENSKHVLDMCAGAGIKTTQISQHNPNAAIIALDINRRKLIALKNNASRLHADNIIAINMDARQASRLGTFDAILLDAPCSGEGLIVFREKAKPRTAEDIISRVELELELLNEALNAAQKNSIIVYATCSMSFEENEYVVGTLLEARGDFELEDPPIRGGVNGFTRYGSIRVDNSLSKCRRYFPHLHGTEGFTICRLRKTR
ncbi:RsmB/NOP family class I SAM-dependent RNA methyltransferase [Pyrofollis japonicus]|uniref:RsmB/NOP family class I SAM-dependent RNA methyltransferase n=1 Tax=Pyrofollis japonicus TaxID=3060460 RepID=UPI00295C1571|nr:RsmB/NOP family class I SAM-dependent RNA methyltransferase [Pyrofollis japonicus]BEP18059.1 RsmB/NOP family class I SAM-dependent RNA methyltransferase [Pyrofollis japonicus]